MKINAETIREYEDRLKPNTFITLTLRQGISSSTGGFIRGCPLAYDRVMKGQLSAVSRRIYGKRRWRKKRQRLPNLSVVEKSYGGLWHIHACLKRPDNVTIEEFTDIFETCWSKSQWAKERFEIEEYRGGGVSYILKDGQDAILTESTNV